MKLKQKFQNTYRAPPLDSAGDFRPSDSLGMPRPPLAYCFRRQCLELQS